MNNKELIDKLERIELLALEIKGRPAASVIAVWARDLIQEVGSGQAANPYALESGETPGRLGKAWQRGCEGLPPSKSWTRGSASWKAYQQGKAAR